MSSAQTLSRQNKIQMLKEIVTVCCELLTMKKDCLDDIDSRNIKKIVGTLRMWQNQKIDTIKNSS